MGLHGTEYYGVCCYYLKHRRTTADRNTNTIAGPLIHLS